MLISFSLTFNKIDKILYISDLNSILDWVEQLNEVNTDNIEPVSSVSMAKLPFRSDKENVNDNSEDVLLNAPEKLENYFGVPEGLHKSFVSENTNS